MILQDFLDLLRVEWVQKPNQDNINTNLIKANIIIWPNNKNNNSEDSFEEKWDQ